MWLGPSSQKEIQSEFDAIFARRVVLGGEVYVTAPEGKVRDVYFGMMARRHHYPDDKVSLLGHGMLRIILSPGHLSRLGAYEHQLSQTPGRGNDPGSFICDVDHWPGLPGDTSGEFFPCQLAHAHLFASRSRRLVIGLEHLLAQGWHVFSKEGDLFSTPMLPLESLSEGALKQMSGIGMHLQPSAHGSCTFSAA